MDSEYLEKTLGKVLTECLTEVCLKRPSDPIEYIALWLYKRESIQKLEAEEAAQKAELERIKREKQMEKERLERLYMESLRLEEEEKERLRLLELEEERLRQLELQRLRELEAQKEQEEKEIEPSPQASNVMIEIGIKTHQVTTGEIPEAVVSDASVEEEQIE